MLLSDFTFLMNFIRNVKSQQKAFAINQLSKFVASFLGKSVHKPLVSAAPFIKLLSHYPFQNEFNSFYDFRNQYLEAILTGQAI